MFSFCSAKDLWYFFTGFLWSLVSFLRALNFPVSQFMSGSPQSMFSSKCSSSLHFYCLFFSAGLLCFLCWGIFFYCPERVPPRWVISWGETRSLVNDGGLVILPHVCNDLRSVQGGRAGGTPRWGQQPGARQNRTIWTSRTVQHFVRESKQRNSRRRLLQMSHKLERLHEGLFLLRNQWINPFCSDQRCVI